MRTGAYARRFDGLAQPAGMRRYGLASGDPGDNPLPPGYTQPDPTAGCPPCSCKKSDIGLLVLGIAIAVPLLGFAILS